LPGQTTGRVVTTPLLSCAPDYETKRLWMRNTICMTDFSEVLHGYNITISISEKKQSAKPSSKHLNPSRRVWPPKR